MGLNTAGTIRRAGHSEDEDTRQLVDNVKAESWKSWPNEAGFVGLEEHRGPIQLKVQGHIPPWAAGSLYRTGPGQTVLQTSRGTHHVSHWFDGFAHTHKFDIEPSPLLTAGDDGIRRSATVAYSSCRQSESLIRDVEQRGWRASFTFAQRADPCVGIFAKAMVVFRPSPPNNNVVVEGNFPGIASGVEPASTEAGHRTGTRSIHVLTDAARMEELHPDTLEPVKFNDPAALHPDLTGPTGCAHSQRDPRTGDLFNFNLSFGLHPTYRIFRVSASSGTTDILASISAPQARPAYIHSFFLTENYVVLCIPSSHFGWNGLKVPWERNIAEAIEPFDESKLTQWVVVDRRHGRGIVARFTTPAGFFFHSVNAFEEEEEEEEAPAETDGGKSRTVLNFDAIWYGNMDVIQSYYHNVILDRNDAARKFWNDSHGYRTCQHHLVRYRFALPRDGQPYHPTGDSSALPTASLAFSIPAPHCGELPIINAARSTLPYHYVYATATRGLSTLSDCIVKTDLATREAVVWCAPRGHTPGEAIFVARPRSEGGSAAEDDGVLLSVVLDGVAGTSYLLVLDARTMEEMGRADADFAIGIGFHGTHAPEIRT